MQNNNTWHKINSNLSLQSEKGSSCFNIILITESYFYHLEKWLDLKMLQRKYY